MSHDSPEPSTRQLRWTATVPSPAAPRRGRTALAVAGVAVLAAVGGASAYLVTRSLTAPAPGPAPSPAVAPATPVAGAATGPINACATIDTIETERLVPRAKVSDSVTDKRDEFSYMAWNCAWNNPSYSFGEYTRNREITVVITQHYAREKDSADTVSRQQYGIELSTSQFRAARPDKESYYAMAKLDGIGDEAHFRYTWLKKNTIAYGEGFGRIGDITIKVEYEASQQRKDSPLFTSKGRTAISEENARREIKLLLGQVSESVAAWRAGKPYARATLTPTPTPTGPAPTPTPTAIAFPKTCEAVTPVAASLVPGHRSNSERTQDGGKTITVCRWNNREIPLPKGLGLRTVYVSFTTFTNRAGVPDPGAARQYYIDLRANAKEWEGSGLEGLFYHKVTEPKDWGDRAHYQYRKNRTPTVHAGIADSAVLIGPTVIEVTHGGSERAKGEPINAPGSVLMPQEQALDGLVEVTEAVVGAFRKTGTD
ncbi:hypothetical protein GCM10010156_60050 [Planobispora rosea]|uniref:Uncharacterized protein n=1 Tax=Planobispora rosea TaxID=35762 RepID=A0A8J3S3X8_PLARO|nr:hypothetical protein [Planobispora rosea]GGS93731.1 hypothetical protein GCM10010156_60050 [Planobispora rosea]GIH87307.1 hypothetical protein Pro02_57150 [Planobispora rosea]